MSAATTVRQHTGFTMVEVLVAIGVIALLMGLMMPVMSRVRIVGRGVECQSNLRQMAQAATTYATRYDYFPPAIRYESVDGVFHRVAWDWVTTMSGEVVEPGPLWRFTDDPDRVMQCPMYMGDANFDGDPYTGFNYNTTYLGGEAPFPSTGWSLFRPGVREVHCRRSDTTVIFGCGGYRAGANKFMRAPMNSEAMPLSTLYAGGQAFRYGGETHAAFIDCHVAAFTQPHEGEHATDELLNDYMGYSKNGFLSDDDRAYDPNWK